MKNDDIPEKLRESLRKAAARPGFDQAVEEARKAFAGVPPEKLGRMIDEAVREVRAKRYRKHTNRP